MENQTLDVNVINGTADGALQVSNIKVIDGNDISDPQVLAMLQAFYSRSPMPIEHRLYILNGEGQGKEAYQKRIKEAIQTYYVGYGDASIGDCGYVTVFVEDVSILAAKAIQDNPLYNGQECSTRYLDFSSQPFIHYSENQKVACYILSGYRELYLRAKTWVRTQVAKEHRIEDVLSDKTKAKDRDKVYAKTLDAITFDIVRGLLPAGALTSLSWTGSLRTLSDHCKYLATSPLPEVRGLAYKINATLIEKYPNAFTHLSQENLPKNNQHYYTALSYEDIVKTPLLAQATSVWFPEGELYARTELGRLQGYPPTYQTSRRLPRHLHELCYFNIQGSLDYGSLRDLLRHRNGKNVLPMLRATDIHPWYKQRLGSSSFISELEDLVAVSASEPEETRQYLLPMSMIEPVNVHWSLGQLQYCLRLRTGVSVHPTLRRWCRELHNSIVMDRPYLAPFLDVDSRADYQASSRGSQTIEKKQTG